MCSKIYSSNIYTGSTLFPCQVPLEFAVEALLLVTAIDFFACAVPLQISPGQRSLLSHNARIIMPKTNSHTITSNTPSTVPRIWMAPTSNVFPTACVAVIIAVFGNTNEYHVMSNWMWCSGSLNCKTFQWAPTHTMKNHRQRPQSQSPAISARSLKKNPADALPMYPSGMILVLTLLPRSTMPATVKPLGPTETNCACQRSVLEDRLQGVN